MSSKEESRDILRLAWRKEIGEQVRLAREAREMTQCQLAEIVGISQQHITMIETGRGNATIGTLGLIASALAAEISIELL